MQKQCSRRDQLPRKAVWQPEQFKTRDTKPHKGALAAMKSLIVYYSWSGTTRTAAEEIQRQTGADVFELVPAKQYPSEYDAVLKISRQEQENCARPALAKELGNASDYGVVYLGFPN